MAGIDLHSNNLMIGIVDQAGRRRKSRKLPCDLQQVDAFLAPLKPRLKSLAVESTYNWYWLVDGLRARDYPVVLANPAQIDQYSGLKHADDQSDAFFLAELQRLDILPTGHIYDPARRPVRDLLRRRLSLGRLKALPVEEAANLYEHPANRLIARIQKQPIQRLDQSIARSERAVGREARRLPFHAKLQTLPGVGRILALTITMETGDIHRFPTAGNFASSSRTVASRRMSNGKQQGRNHQKCGNRYLAWSFIEAANFAKRSPVSCRRWFDRKAAKTSPVIATKALAGKLAQAAWHVMKTGNDHDPKRMLPEVRSAEGS